MKISHGILEDNIQKCAIDLRNFASYVFVRSIFDSATSRQLSFLFKSFVRQLTVCPRERFKETSFSMTICAILRGYKE